MEGATLIVNFTVSDEFAHEHTQNCSLFLCSGAKPANRRPSEVPPFPRDLRRFEPNTQQGSFVCEQPQKFYGKRGLVGVVVGHFADVLRVHTHFSPFVITCSSSECAHFMGLRNSTQPRDVGSSPTTYTKEKLSFFPTSILRSRYYIRLAQGIPP